VSEFTGEYQTENKMMNIPVTGKTRHNPSFSKSHFNIGQW